MSKLQTQTKVCATSPHMRCVFGLDFVKHPNLVRFAPRIPILADIFLCHLIYVLIGVLLGYLINASAHFEIPVRVIGILNRESYSAVAFHVFVLASAPR